MGRVFGASRGGGLGNLGSLRVGLELPIKIWNKNYKSVTADVKKYPKTTEKALKRAGKSWKFHTGAIKGAAIGMAAFGTAVTVAFGMAVNEAATFQQSMVNTQAVVGATSDELQELTSFAREMGKQTVFSATESATAMNRLGSAGLDTKEIMDSLKGTLDLAAATQSDLAFTSRTVASTLSQFGLAAEESGRISNVFAATISASQATMDKLSTSMSIVGPVAKAVGLSLEETAGILGSLFNAGLDASTAGTSLRQSLAQLLRPTDDAKEALQRLNVETFDSQGKLRSLTDIIRDLEKSGLSAADALAIFGVRAGPGMLALVSKGADAIEDLTEKVTDTNKASEIAALQIGTFQGQIKILQSAISELKITIGNELLPVLTEYTTKLTGIINKTSDWAAANPALSGTLVKVGAATGGVALGLAGIAATAFGISKVVGVLGLMAVDVGILAGAIGGIGGVATVGAIGFTLVFGLTSIALSMKELISPTKDAGTALHQMTMKVWDSTQSLEANLTALKNVRLEAEDLKTTLPDVFTGTQIAGVKEYGTAAALTNSQLGNTIDTLLKIDKAQEQTIEGQLARSRLVLESMDLEQKEIDAIIKAEEKRLRAAIVGSKEFIARQKELAEEISKTGKEALEEQKAFLFPEVDARKQATDALQRADKEQVAVIKDRTKWEKDWVEVNGILRLKEVEKVIDIELGLLQDETKEQRKIRIEAAKQARKDMDRAVLDEVTTETATFDGKLKRRQDIANKVIKVEEKALLQRTDFAKTEAETVIAGGELIRAVHADGIKSGEEFTQAMIMAGETRGVAIEQEAKKRKEQIELLKKEWANFSTGVINIFGNISRTSRVFADSWFGTMTDWAIGNRKILTTVKDLWQGNAESISGSAVSIFSTMTSLIDSLVDARRQISRLESEARASDIEAISGRAGLSFKEAAALRKERLRERTKEEIAALREGGGQRIARRTRALAGRDIPGVSPERLEEILGMFQPGQGEITRIPIIDAAGEPPLTFTPRRPEGTDRFGRPIDDDEEENGDASMAPAAPRQAGDVTFGDIIVNLDLSGVTDIRDLDTAELERLAREGLIPAFEAVGFRLVRSDNVMAS